MKRLKHLFLVLFLLGALFSPDLYAANKFLPFIGLTGSGTGSGNSALDGIAVAGLTDGDYAHGYNSTQKYQYHYVAASVITESLPWVVTPNDSGGAGRWELLLPGELQYVQLEPTSGLAHSEGLFYYDENTHAFTAYNEEADFSQQIGQEGVIRVYNNTGSTIADGKICYLSGATNGGPTVGLAIASDATTCLGTIGWSTHSIENGTWGYITRWGLLNDQNTIGLSGAEKLWLSPSSAGDYVTTVPTSPNYLIGVGSAVEIHATTGTIDVSITIGTNTGGVIKIFNGSVLEDTSTVVSSNGSVVSLSYEQNGGGDLSLFFNGGFDILDCTPAITISLTAGSDTAPTLNYVYIPESTMVLTVSTSSFPAVQHVPIATVMVQSAVSVQTDGAYKVHAWTDHLTSSNNQGHLSHVNHWIREQHATYLTGINYTFPVTINPSAIDNINTAVTSGEILQLHDHAFPAINTASGGHIYAINDNTSAYRRITDLSDLDETSTGATLRSNNTYYSLVLWGVVSEAAGDCQLYVNESSGFYSGADEVSEDLSKYSNYTIPNNYKGTGFLIARVNIRYQTADSGTLTVESVEDLRGLTPSTAGGGGGGSASNEFSDNLFGLFNVGDVTKKLSFSLSGITTGITRLLTIGDYDSRTIHEDVVQVDGTLQNEVVESLGTVGGFLTIDISQYKEGIYPVVTLTENYTITFTGVPLTSRLGVIVLNIKNGDAYTGTIAGKTLTFSTANMLVGLITTDGGTTYEALAPGALE